jgi:HEAT repeat protein/CheY-like chemotaxis protein
LGKLADVQAVEPLIATLMDEDWPGRSDTAEVLGRLGDARAVEPLIVALTDESPGGRKAAARALGRLSDPSAVGPLITALADENKWVQGAAAGALGRLGDTRAVKPLITALTERDKFVRAVVADALGRLADVQAVEPLIAALADKDWTVRKAVAEALGWVGDTRAAEPLIDTLADVTTFWSVAWALGKLNDARAIEPLVAVFEGKDAGLRQAAAQALSKLGYAPTVELLTGNLPDKHSDSARRDPARRITGQPVILHIDDDRGMRCLVRLILERENFQVLDAADGFEGLNLATQAQPDLILLDIMMPSIDGFNVFYRLSEATSIPVTFITARNSPEEGLQLGAADYIIEPFLPAEFVARCRRVLRATGWDEL